MSGTCYLLAGWERVELISQLRNITNLTEEVLVSSSLCTTLKLLTVLNWVIQIVGIVCNAVSLAVLHRLQRKLPFDYCLMFLASFDNVFLFSCLARSLLGELVGVPTKHLAVFVVLQCISWTASLWATVGVSVERFTVIFYTFRAKSLCTFKRIIFFNMFILCFAIVVNVPLFIVLQNIQWDEDLMKTYMYLYNKHGKSLSSYIPHWFFINKEFFEICYLYVNFVFMFCLPLVGNAILGTCICMALRKAEKIRNEMTRSQGIKYYRYLVFKGLLTVFLLTYFATLSFEISYYSGVLSISGRVIELFCCFLISTNSSAKIIIYTSLWKDFRDTLRRMRPEHRIQNVITRENITAV